MSDASDPPESDRRTATTERDELRTIAFRMREIQRLLGRRVEQENRRLEADGIEPVSYAGFQDQLESADRPGE